MRRAFVLASLARTAGETPALLGKEAGSVAHPKSKFNGYAAHVRSRFACTNGGRDSRAPTGEPPALPS